MGEVSAIGTLTKVNNLNISKKILDHLGWLPNDQILEKTNEGQINLQNLSLDSWKDGNVDFNNWLYFLMRDYKGKFIFLIHFDEAGIGWHSYSNFVQKISNFNKQFKGRFEHGQIAPAEILNKGYYGSDDDEIVNELKRFYNVRDIDSLTVFNFNLLTIRDPSKLEEVQNELLAFTTGSNDSAKMLLPGVIKEYKVFERVLKQNNIQDCLFINVHNDTYFEIVEGKVQTEELIPCNH